MKKLVEQYCELPRGIRKPLWRLAHFLIRKWDQKEMGTFLNYGYAGQKGQFDHLSLEPSEQANRHGIQLYQYVTQKVPFEQAGILEVGCGRGGGAAWLAKNRRPESYIGMDISEHVINFCKQKYNTPALSFVRGEAEHLPFANRQFDVLINIESARCYGSIPAFFREAHRVIKPGGHFLFADMIRKEDTNEIRSWLGASGFSIREEEEITENVVRSLQADSPARMKFIQEYVPGYMRKAFQEFAGVEGSNRFHSFYSGAIEYWRFILKKK
jgi:ubiquinone/menaquinone biosynthesis C-methylase UbiE